MNAAENCFVSPQGISNAIRRLEAELQCTLFVRSRAGLSLTKHARFLLPLAEKTMDNIDVCDKYFSIGKNLHHHVQLVLAKGAFEAFAEAPIKEFIEAHPHIFLDLRNESDVGAETAVLCKEAELALCSGPVNTELFDARYICSSRFAVFVRVNHPLAELDMVSVTDLRPYPLTIMQEHTKTYPLLLDAANAAGTQLWVNSRVGNMTLVFESAEYEGQVGIATMALEYIANKPKSLLKAIPFREQSLRWSLHIIKRKDEPLSPNADLLYKILLKHQALMASEDSLNE